MKNAAFRHELKYIVHDSTLKVIERKIESIMRPDPHADKNGEYVIRSVYFDDYQKSCFFENEDGVDPREKFRLRTYNYSMARISLEKKIKMNGMTAKDICLVDIEQCKKMIHVGYGLEISDKLPVLLKEWSVQNATRRLRPVMLGEYVRKPFIHWLGNVRITFDRNICASRQVDFLFEKDISRIAVLPSGYHVLEVKWDDFLPDIIYQLIEDRHMLQTTFSKFYLGCKALGGNTYEL